MKKTLGQGYQSIESQVNEKRKQGELSLGEIVALDLTEIPGRYLLLMVKQDGERLSTFSLKHMLRNH